MRINPDLAVFLTPAIGFPIGRARIGIVSRGGPSRFVAAGNNAEGLR
jgi:hypothetical protein